MTHDNPIAWECPHGSGIRQFITQAQYERFSPRIKSFYKPYHCTSCATSADQLAVAMALPEVRALTAAAHCLNDEVIMTMGAKRSSLAQPSRSLTAALAPFGKATE